MKRALAGAFLLALLAGFVWIGGSGAAVVDAAPWAGSTGTYNTEGSNTLAGECNEMMVAGADDGWSVGYGIDIACQGMLPVGDAGISNVGAAIDAAGFYYHVGYGAGWSFEAEGGSGAWINYGAENASDIGLSTGDGSTAGASSCAELNGTPSWDIDMGRGYTDAYSAVDCEVSPESDNYAYADMVESVSDVVTGAASTASDGDSYVPVRFYAQEVIMADPGDNSPGTYLTHAALEPASGSPGYTGGACSTVTPPSGTFVVVNTAIGTTGANDVAPYPAGGVGSSLPLHFALDSLGCKESGSNEPADAVTMPSNYYTGGSDSGSPSTNCDLISWSGPDGADFPLNTPVDYSFTYSGNVARIVVDPDDGSTPTQAIDGQTFSKDAAAENADGSGTTNVDVTATAAPGGTGLEFWCWDGSQWWDWGTSTLSASSGTPPGGPPGSPGAVSFGECFATAGWSLTDPVSWVTGGIKVLTCVVEWAVIPSSSSIEGFEELFGIGSDAPSGTAPAAEWVGSLTNMLLNGPADAVSAVQADASDGGCTTNGPGTFPIRGHEFSVCASIASVSTAATSAGGGAAWTALQALLTAAVYMTAFIGLVWFFRHLLVQT